MASAPAPRALYFAYGRNMSAAAFDAACPGNRFLGAAELSAHRLAFTRRSVRTGTGVADILESPGHSVWGALYELPGPRALAALDRKEGRGWAYERKPVRVRLGGGDHSTREAFAYAVIAPDGAHVAPSEEYVRALLDGARERGLPDAYAAMLAELAVAPAGERR